MKRNDVVKLSELKEGDVFRFPGKFEPGYVWAKWSHKMTYLKNGNSFHRREIKNLEQVVIYLRTV